MAQYNGNHPIYNKSKLEMFINLDKIGINVVNFADECTIEAEKDLNIKSSGYTVLFIPGKDMDIMLTFLMMSDKSAIVLVALPEYGHEGYIKDIMIKVKTAIKDSGGE